MSKFSKLLIAFGAASMITTPIAASAAGGSLPTALVGGTEAENAAMLGGLGFGTLEIAGILALLISLGLIVGGNSQSN